MRLSESLSRICGNVVIYAMQSSIIGPDNEYAIAEPHEDIVELIEYIERELSKPVTVGDMFTTKSPYITGY